MARSKEQNQRYYQNRKTKANAEAKPLRQQASDDYYYHLTQGSGRIGRRYRMFLSNPDITADDRESAIAFAKYERALMYARPYTKSNKPERTLARRKGMRDKANAFYASALGQQIYEHMADEYPDNLGGTD